MYVGLMAFFLWQSFSTSQWNLKANFIGDLTPVDQEVVLKPVTVYFMVILWTKWQWLQQLGIDFLLCQPYRNWSECINLVLSRDCLKTSFSTSQLYGSLYDVLVISQVDYCIYTTMYICPLSIDYHVYMSSLYRLSCIYVLSL